MSKVTFEQAFKFPLSGQCSYIFDQDNAVVLQFINNKQTLEERMKVLSIINEESDQDESSIYSHVDGYIFKDNYPYISIRSWGRLTSPAVFNLPSDEAVKLQDELAEFIINRLTKKY